MNDGHTYGPGEDATGAINYALPPRGVAHGKPPKGLRNHDCRHDGHSDPDNSGLCIYCAVILDSLSDAVDAIPRYFVDFDGCLQKTDDKKYGDLMRVEDVLRAIDPYK